ncbi:MAG: R3H domain-containing nucleic acid-binding protein [Armatimonadota bacterium]|nr:AAA family ATPase [bacterium]MCS7308729.1 AAA family ATPase [Armatimonadota bacterium]MDW8103646.1 R3H domain-containing nucleic acid-binding protein [Armatimonadota bacterium]MDW8289726.1 R3H domain-containing nucleic acid-binding protein [Armatimonadota bacterium]
MSSFNFPTGAPIAQRPKTQLRVTDNLDELLAVLPPQVRRALEQEPSLDDLLEVILDLGREPQARFPDRTLKLSDMEVTEADIDYVVQRVGAFGKDNRAGIERTLHRISAIRNRQGRIIGLTCRVGRAVFGTIDIIQDVIERGKSVLMLGRPGIGKTTKLREIARVLADEFNKRVVIVDTSNEIAGDGDIPHPAIGMARRMQVASPELQHAVMIEAVENHMPEVIVIDEIGTEAEAFAARTIAERGVQLIGTAHGNSLENLLMNPTLCDLVGGIQAVTLSDEEARRRGTQKTVLERKAPPTFDIIIEMIEKDKLAIHHDVASTVDRILRGETPRPEVRVRLPDGTIQVVQAGDTPEPAKQTGALTIRPSAPKERKQLPSTVRIFPYGVSRNRLERAIRELRVPAYIVRDVQQADVVIALKANARREPARMKEASVRGLPVYVVKSNTYAQIASSVQDIFAMRPPEGWDDSEPTLDPTEAALLETEAAIHEVLRTSMPVDLSPQNSYIRRLQHQLVEKYRLVSESVGVEPNRRVRISPPPG